jgi:hypothetical protein
MKTRSKILFSLFAVLLIVFASQASANLVTNGGFETGDFTGWTQSGNTGFTSVEAYFSHSGTYQAQFAPMGSNGFLSQDLTTVAGSTYTLSFWLANQFGGDNHFEVSFGGVVLLSLDDVPLIGYTQYTFNGLPATGALTSLQFGFRNEITFFRLDDVSVELTGNAVPESFSTLWLAAPLLGMAAFARLRRKES